MQAHTHLLKSLFGKATLAAAALAGFLFFAGTPSAQGHDRDDCRRAIQYNDWRLHEAIEHRGYYSREANHWRHERHEAYERCWRNRDRDWDGYRYRDRY